MTTETAQVQEPVYDHKLFNKGKRKIDHTRGSLQPQTAGAFTEAEAAKLLRLYSHELIDMNNVTVESLTTAGAGEKLASESKADAEDIARRLADARVMRKQKAYDAAIEEGFGEDEAREIAGLPPVLKAGEEAADDSQS